MSKIQNSFVVPKSVPQTNTAKSPIQNSVVAKSDNGSLVKDAFESATQLLGSLGLKNAGELLAPIAKDLGFDVSELSAQSHHHKPKPPPSGSTEVTGSASPGTHFTDGQTISSTIHLDG